MKPLIVQFAVFWGQAMGSAMNSAEQEKAAKMMVFDSMELTDLFTDWATEFTENKETDVASFFNDKLEKTLKRF